MMKEIKLKLEKVDFCPTDFGLHCQYTFSEETSKYMELIESGKFKFFVEVDE